MDYAISFRLWGAALRFFGIAYVFLALVYLFMAKIIWTVTPIQRDILLFVASLVFLALAASAFFAKYKIMEEDLVDRLMVAAAILCCLTFSGHALFLFIN